MFCLFPCRRAFYPLDCLKIRLPSIDLRPSCQNKHFASLRNYASSTCFTKHVTYHRRFAQMTRCVLLHKMKWLSQTNFPSPPTICGHCIRYRTMTAPCTNNSMLDEIRTPRTRTGTRKSEETTAKSTGPSIAT